MTSTACRFCESPLVDTFANLGMSPLANSYLKPEQLQQKELFFPLHVYVCSECFLVQLEEFESPEHIFSDYLYFSSFSASWLDHCESYTDMMVDRFVLDTASKVVEVASNDGYLLQYFQERGVPVLGVEPAANVAKAAIDKGIPTEVAFFGVTTAQRLRTAGHDADVITANNVLAHVPDLHDFVSGLQILLKPDAVVTIEFPHLLQLMAHNQFDTIYHEHFSYFSFTVAEKVLAAHGLRIFDVQELPTHGGSLRIFACHSGCVCHPNEPAVEVMRLREVEARLTDLGTYRDFAENVVRTKCDVLEFFIQARREGKSLVGYGAPAKGNTLLNYCGIGTEFISFTVDRNIHKQGHFLPGTHIPILAPEEIAKVRPDYVFILPWNLKEEIMEQMADVRSWGGSFVIPIPTLQVL